MDINSKQSSCCLASAFSPQLGGKDVLSKSKRTLELRACILSLNVPLFGAVT